MRVRYPVPTVVLLILAAAFLSSRSVANAAAAVTDTLTVGQTLAPGGQLTSAGGGYRAVMQGDGNLVVYTAGMQPIWASGTYRDPGASVTMQADGNLVLYTGDMMPIWASATFPSSNTRLIMQADGNLVLYNGGGQALWSSMSGPVHLQNLGTNGRLTSNQQLIAPGGGYEAVMQGDGNLVVYTAGMQPIWSTGTYRDAGASVAMQGDGNLVVYTAAMQPVWASATSGSGASLTMQADGNLVLYDAAGRPLWSSIFGRVAPGYGVGPNAYLCASTDYSCDTTGYVGQPVWDFLGPHNCTDYAAWRLQLRGVARPGNLGDGGDWAARAASFGIPVDQTPAVGAVAEYDFGSSFAPSGHVGYVTEVGPGYIVVTEDNFPGRQPGQLDVRRAVAGTSWWPNNFIHF